jgi:hypothetical protein
MSTKIILDNCKQANGSALQMTSIMMMVFNILINWKHMPVVSRVKKPLKWDPSLASARNVSVVGL